MRRIFVCAALFVVAVSASPVALESKTDDSVPLKVVDVPAGVFENAEDTKVEEKIQPDPVIPVDVKQVEIIEDKPLKETEISEDGPNVFGIRFPSILIIRRPAAFQDPFSGFQSPFFSGRPRPSIFSSSPFDSIPQQSKDIVKEKESVPLSVSLAGQDEQQRQNDTRVVNNVIQRMHQQINNLFANLFNPDSFLMQRPSYSPPRPMFQQRPTFPRPSFTRPSLFSPFGFDESAEDDKLDFGKLPPNYSNSTSETKIVDGQLVTVNKTVHKISGNNSNGFFQFSVIKVGPNQPQELPTADIPEKTLESEIHSVKEETTINPELELDPKLNEVDRPEQTEQEKLTEVELKNKYEIDNSFPSDSKQLLVDEEIKIVPIKSEKLVKSGSNKVSDLSSDIRINNMMENAAQGRIRALFDPDEVEIFDV